MPITTREAAKDETASQLLTNQQNLFMEYSTIMNDFVAFALPTFKDSTPLSSLAKLEEELGEVREDIINGKDIVKVSEEYADCLMCIIDSAARYGISPCQLMAAFYAKLVKNKSRNWTKNPDNTYSHDKKHAKIAKLSRGF